MTCTGHNEVRTALLCNFGNREVGSTAGRQHLELRVDARRLQVDDLQARLVLQVILISMDWKGSASHRHQLVDVRDLTFELASWARD
jgi:hypothetical protein